MKQQSINKMYFIGVVLIGCIVVGLVISVFILSSPRVSAQEEDKALEQLFSRLNEDILQYSTININFVHTAMGEFDEFIVGLEGPPRNTIIETGKDYVCFSSDTGGVDYIFCTPFSNIASIDYVAQR